MNGSVWTFPDGASVLHALGFACVLLAWLENCYKGQKAWLLCAWCRAVLAGEVASAMRARQKATAAPCDKRERRRCAREQFTDTPMGLRFVRMMNRVWVSYHWHILVVDDDPHSLDLLSRRLLRYGYRVTTACSASQVLASFETCVPDLVLLDILMPQTTGIELLASIRSTPATQDVPVILVSALGFTEDIVTGLQAGASDYITKPVNMPVLLARIQAQLKVAHLLKKMDVQRRVIGRLGGYDEGSEAYSQQLLLQMLEAELGRAMQQASSVSVLLLRATPVAEVKALARPRDGARAEMRELSRQLLAQLRPADTLYRYGDELFCAILPETSESEALRIAQLLLRAVGREACPSAPFTWERRALHVGVACVSSHETCTAGGLLENASLALRQAEVLGASLVGAPEHRFEAL